MPEFDNIHMIAQLIGFLGTIAVVVGMQQKKYNGIVFCKILNEFLASIHYFLIGGYTGMVINFASCMTNGVYWYRITKGKSTLIFQILFGAMFVTLGALSWQGSISIFVILAKLISSVSLGIKNPRAIRILNLISNPCWLVYNLYLGTVAGIVTDTLVLTSVIIAVVRLDILKKQAIVE